MFANKSIKTNIISMSFKGLFVFTICCFFSFSTLANTEFLYSSYKLDKKRIIIVSAGVSVGLTASYLYAKKNWWSEQESNFHFDNGPDLRYALNVDKAGHFLGGLHASEIFSSSLSWVGVNHKKSLLFGACFGTMLQLGIELKDAYAPYWGFSKWDLGCGTLGSFWPVIKHYNSFLNPINFKFSYYRHTDTYLKLENEKGNRVTNMYWQDDYPNQTYWMTIDINKYLKNSIFPSWMNIAIGFGLDDSQKINNEGKKIGGQNEWYLAVDYNISKLFRKCNNPILKKLIYWIDYIHFPAPTIRFSPSFKFYPLFI